MSKDKLGNEYKKYTLQAKRCIKGEAFFESLICTYALATHIVGPKDLGIDYICQWVFDNRPTEILFAIQVKTFGKDTYETKSNGEKDVRGNCLEMFTINNPNLTIDNHTIAYWQTIGMPIFLFAICDEEKEMSCYYKRFTPVITESRGQQELPFYKVNEGTSFLAFSDQSKKTGGFTRDLFIDYIRCCYSKGLLTYLNPRSIGLAQFPEGYAVFVDLLNSYEDRIRRTYEQTKQFIEKYDGEKGHSG
jgi:hypothetical protein